MCNQYAGKEHYNNIVMNRLDVKGIIFDIDHFVVHDGEGIRTCIYLKGCPLHCAWCHSPESQEIKPQILFAGNRCVGCGLCAGECPGHAQLVENRKRVYRREKCSLCGACIKICPSGALTVAGKEYTAAEAAAEALADKVFFKNSGGGVTLSGGEVLMQPEFTLELLKIFRENEVHTILETTGYGSTEALLEMADYADLFFYDFKLADPEKFRRYIGGDVNIVMNNLRRLREKTDKIVLRFPAIPGITDTEENVDALYDTARELKISQIHFLPYNSSAGAKYEWCGREYELGELKADMEKLERFKKNAPEHIEVTVMN